MRIGLAGAGRIGAFHASTIANLADVEQVVVTDVSAPMATRLADDNGYESSPDLDDLLGRVDALIITTSTSGHAPTLRAALAAKVPTFCEKPVAATLAETIELVRLVGEADVPVQVGFQRRFDMGYARAPEAGASGELGFLPTGCADTHDPSPPPPGYIPTSGGLFPHR